jgi:hypothetical protein
MKLPTLLSLALFAPMPVFAQQTNIYQVCTNYQENYSPGYYNQYGNYVQGNVNTQSYNVNCQNQTYYRPNGGYVQPSPVVTPIAQPSCAAAPIGAILGGFGAYKATRSVPNRWWSVPLGVVTGGIVGNALCN